MLGQVLLDLAEDLRTTALSHSTWVDPRSCSYERLEFLGDSVLACVVAAELYARHPQADEGELTQRKINAVSGAACARVARGEGLDRLFLAAAPTDRGRAAEELVKRESVLAALTESALGAIFVARGYEEARSAVLSSFAAELSAAAGADKDPKTRLQELVQARGASVRYVILETGGPAHDREFQSAVLLGEDELGRGSGRSVKASEAAAAVAALRGLETGDA